MPPGIIPVFTPVRQRHHLKYTPRFFVFSKACRPADGKLLGRKIPIRIVALRASSLLCLTSNSYRKFRNPSTSNSLQWLPISEWIKYKTYLYYNSITGFQVSRTKLSVYDTNFRMDQTQYLYFSCYNSINAFHAQNLALYR